MASRVITITGGPLTGIKFGAAGLEAVIQNVRCILATRIGTVILDRDFGVDAGILDLPILAARMRLLAEIVTKVERFEPRVRVFKIDFVNPGTAATEAGVIVPRVEVSIRDGVLL